MKKEVEARWGMGKGLVGWRVGEGVGDCIDGKKGVGEERAGQRWSYCMEAD